jgi:hypothetical protein
MDASGGTFISRQAALREIDDQICILGRVTIIMIEPDGQETSGICNSGYNNGRMHHKATI